MPSSVHIHIGTRREASTGQIVSPTIEAMDNERKKVFHSILPHVGSIITYSKAVNEQTGQPEAIPQGMGAAFAFAKIQDPETGNNKMVFATNKHVVLEAQQDPYEGLVFETSDVAPDGTHRERQIYTSAKVEYISPDFDVAFVSLDPQEHSENEFKPLLTGSAKDLTVGTTIGTLGQPYAMQDVGAVGIVTHDVAGGNYQWVDGEMGNNPYFQVDAALRPGNSGGVAIKMATGEIVGIPTIQLNGDPTAGLAIPIDLVVEEFTRWQKMGSAQ